MMMKKDEHITTVDRLWYVAQVLPRHEIKVRERLTLLGYEACVPSQKETHRWKNRRTGQVEKIFIPGVVFVRLNDEERNLMVNFPFIKKFLVNRALPVGKVGRAVHPFATYNDEQMTRLQQRMETTAISPELASQYPLEVLESLKPKKQTI